MTCTCSLVAVATAAIKKLQEDTEETTKKGGDQTSKHSCSTSSSIKSICNTMI